jgi:hypothetical protein
MKHVLKYLGIFHLFKWNLQNQIIIQQRPKQTCHWTLVWFTPKRRDFRKMVLYTWWNFVPTNTGLVKDGTTHNVCVCVRINADLSKMVLCTGCGCAHRHRLCQRWLTGTGACVCVREREREHTNMDLETVIANELTHHGVLGFNPKPNRKLFHDHLPSIFHSVLVDASSLWHEGSAYQRIVGIPHCPTWFLGQVT